MDVFTQLYGAEAGNLALKLLPFGGLYIAGGIALKILWAIRKNNQFMESLLSKGRMRGLLEKMPVYIVNEKNVGLLGAQVVCKRIIQNNSKTKTIPSKL